jgi:hypothetical protein
MQASLLGLFTLVFALAAKADSAFHMDSQRALVVETIDPIVSPNAYGGHSHRVIGGSGFSAAYDRDDYSSSSCSSLPVQGDKSNYWIPRKSRD